MKKLIFCVLLCSAISGFRAFGAEVNDIYLSDGSVLRAEVVSLQNGVYTLRSASMGEFTLDASRVSQIGNRQPGQNSLPGAPLQFQQQPSESQQAFQAKVASTQAVIMNDPEGMKAAMSMASDPDFQKLIEDPEAVAALKSGDLPTLMKKPQFRVIMDNPKMQGFISQMKDKMQDQQQ
jgi:hypothetical protein